MFEVHRSSVRVHSLLSEQQQSLVARRPGIEHYFSGVSLVLRSRLAGLDVWQCVLLRLVCERVGIIPCAVRRLTTGLEFGRSDRH